MSARLIGRTGKVRGTEATVSDLFTVGSGTANDLRIELRTISRKHAQILRVGTEFYLEDLGSRNGTFLNGQRVKRFPIRHLDVVSIGPDVDLIFLETGVAAPIAPRPLTVRAAITWLDGPLAGRTEEVVAGRGLILGRRDDLPLQAVSRRHAALTVIGDRVTVEDLGSANGTSVNGERISAVTVLADGDEVALGDLVRCRISLQGTAAPAVAPKEDHQFTVVVDERSPRGGMPALEMPRRVSIAQPDAESPRVPPAITQPAGRQGEGAAAPAGAGPSGASPVSPVPAEPSVEPPVPPPVPDSAAAAPPASATVAAPREAAVAPRPPVNPVPAVEPPRDATVLAPRQAAAAPSLGPPRHLDGPPPVPREGETFKPPKEPAGSIPSGIAARARAARNAAEGTMELPPAVQPAVPVPPVAAPPPNTPAVGIQRVRLAGPQSAELQHGTYTVGRHPDCELHIDVRDVGRRHARLTVDESGLTVENLASANGTFVNDVEASVITRVPHGARLRFATVEFSVAYLREGE